MEIYKKVKLNVKRRKTSGEEHHIPDKNLQKKLLLILKV